MPQLAQHRQEYAVAQPRQVARVAALAAEPGEDERAAPFASQYGFRVRAVERDEPIVQRARAIGDQFFPVGIPCVDFVVHAIDQRVLARKVSVQQWLGNTDLPRELPEKPCVAT